jgi:protoporphyrinogen/coproporphyrinogen III oxidase
VTNPERHVVVVGGGITGLAAARQLAKAPAPPRVTLVEADERLGGKIRTTPFGGVPVDEGADAFLARVPWALDLCRQLGMGGRLLSPATSAASVVVDGTVRRLPEGLVLGIPTNLRAVAEAGVLSRAGVARAALDLVKGDDWPGTDEPIGALVRRRLGDEVLANLVDPLLGSINAGDTDRLSLWAAAPQLAEVARHHRSLIAGVREQRRRQADDPAAPLFYTLPEGMQQLVRALVTEQAGSGRVEHCRSVSVERLDGTAAGGSPDDGAQVLRLGLSDGRTITADGVVLAVPAPAAAALVATSAPAARPYLGQVEMASVVLVTMAFRRDEVAHPLDTSGVLVPVPEGRLMTACSFASSKWPHWSDDAARVVLRASAGRHRDERAMALDDDELVDVLLGELNELLGVQGPLLEWRVSRWPASFPQYAPGHLRRVAAAEDELARRMPTVALAGASYRGLGIPACIRQGQEAAQLVLDRLAP